MNSVKTGGTSPQIPDTGQGQYPSQATPPLTGRLQGRSRADNQSTRPAYNPIHTNPTNDTIFNSRGDLRGNREATKLPNLLSGAGNQRGCE